MKTTVAAVDLGATSGRVIVGLWSQGHLELTEAHRFPNAIHPLGRHSYWEVGHLFTEVLKGLREAHRTFPELRSVGVDTWGVDYALVNRAGRLVAPVHAYRDERTEPLLAELKTTPGLAQQVYEWSGLPPINYNSSLQLAETLRSLPAIAQLADRVLFLPDYLNYLLSGQMVNEVSIASTTQLLDARTVAWSAPALAHFGIPPHWLGEPTTAGRILGPIDPKLKLPGVVSALVPGHDTSCAFEAIPRQPGDLILSAGTWLLLGGLTDGPALSPEAFAFGISNERTGSGGWRPCKILLGLWLLEQLLPAFAERPRNDLEWAALIERAEAEPTPAAVIDTTDASLFHPADMRRAVDDHLAARGLARPTSLPGYVRLVCDSLATSVAQAARRFGELSDTRFRRVVVVGGGSKNRLLCQRLADLAGLPVTSYSLEGTAMGNIAYQLLALGAVPSLGAFHEAIEGSLSPRHYLPQP